MNREEAAYLLRDIISCCEDLNEQTATLIPANGDTLSLSLDCRIHIEPSVSERNFQHIKKLVKNTNLSVIDKPDSNVTVIYGDIKE